MSMKQQLKREIARQYLTRKYGDDRGFLAAGEVAFAFVHDRQILTIGYDEVPEEIRREALFVIEHEQRVA